MSRFVRRRARRRVKRRVVHGIRVEPMYIEQKLRRVVLWYRAVTRLWSVLGVSKARLTNRVSVRGGRRVTVTIFARTPKRFRVITEDYPCKNAIKSITNAIQTILITNFGTFADSKKVECSKST